MSNKKCVKEKYLYLSAMLRAREAKMLSRDKAERMLDAASFDEAAKILTDCGYEDMSAMSAKEIETALIVRRDAVFTEIARLCPDAETVDIFRIKYDYHNAKALLKAEACGLDRADLLSGAGRVSPEALTAALTDERFLGIPSKLADAIVEAKNTLARTANPQLADFVLDKAYFDELLDSAQRLGSDFMKDYAKVLIDSANLRSAVRTLRMGKDTDFLRLALVPGGGVDVGKVLASAGSGDALAAAYANGPLAAAAAKGAEAVGGGRMTEFELACDNAVSAYLTRARLIAFGDAPVIAYLAAIEGEISTVRMILTGRLAGIEPQTIRERLRDYYA